MEDVTMKDLLKYRENRKRELLENQERSKRLRVKRQEIKDDIECLNRKIERLALEREEFRP